MFGGVADRLPGGSDQGTKPVIETTFNPKRDSASEQTCSSAPPNVASGSLAPKSQERSSYRRHHPEPDDDHPHGGVDA
jgi:hypothetical protein